MFLSDAITAGSAVSPKQLKHLLGKFAPQFSGYQQQVRSGGGLGTRSASHGGGSQDAHELLAFLLDGIHEDLNRVIEKPYVEVKELPNASTMPDADLARHFWGLHELRNRSIVVDLFHAQLKVDCHVGLRASRTPDCPSPSQSTIMCPTPQDGGCSRVSVTFDPFVCLSVPFPTGEVGRTGFFGALSVCSLARQCRRSAAIWKWRTRVTRGCTTGRGTLTWP